MRMRYHFSLLMSLALALAACATTAPSRPITGRTVPSNEAFTGSFKGSVRSDASVILSNAGGVACTGNYSSVSVGSYSSGLGTLDLTCDDGRSANVLMHENDKGKLFGVGQLGKDTLIIEE